MISKSKYNNYIRYFLSTFLMMLFIATLLNTLSNYADYKIRKSVIREYIGSDLMRFLYNKEELKDQSETIVTPKASSYHGPYTILPKRTWAIPYKEKWRNYTLPFITCKPNGRLGNVMGEYATLYALKRAYGTSVALHPTMHEYLHKIFKNITIPIIRGDINMKELTPITYKGQNCNFAQVEVAAAGLLGPKPFIITQWAFEMHLFHAYSSDMILEFQFNDDIQTIARKRMQQARQRWSTLNNAPADGLTFVSFHIRRTDYFKHIKEVFGGEMPGMNYFLKAMEYYKNKFKKVVFVMSSDDPDYIKTTFPYDPEIFLNLGLTPEQDMCVISFCNHSIVTLGSYGFWGAYLTGGEVIYPEVNATIQGYSFSRPYYEEAHIDRFKELSVT